MSRRPYQPDGGSHWRVKVCGVFCQIYISFLKDACVFVDPFRSFRVLAGTHAKEEYAYDQLADGYVQMCVFLLVDVEDFLFWYIFLVFRC